MPTDEVLIRDCCGKSSSIIKKYFYYNEYDKDNFPFMSDYNELTLLDLLDGKISFIDLISKLVPYILIFIFAFICIGIYISICCCSCRPKCLLKKDNKNPHKKRFICFIIFSGFSLIIIVLGSIILFYIYSAEKDFNGSICSLLMFLYEIINGKGLLARNQIYKPYWYGTTEIGNSTEKIGDLLSGLKNKCIYYKTEFGEDILNDTVNAGEELIKSLGKLYFFHNLTKITVPDPSDLSNDPQSEIDFYPIYISNLGPIENNETYIGNIRKDFQTHFEYILREIMVPAIIICSTIINLIKNNQN